MNFLKTKKERMASSLIVPLLVQSLLLSIDRKFNYAIGEWYDWMAIGVSAFVGFGFLFKDFQWKAIFIGLVYLPLIYFLLFWYSFLFVAVVFGDTM